VAKCASSKKVGDGCGDLFRRPRYQAARSPSAWRNCPLVFATVMTTHAAYDVYFDKLCDLLINGDKFDTDVLEDNDSEIPHAGIIGKISGKYFQNSTEAKEPEISRNI
jgi:hypothetical protein